MVVEIKQPKITKYKATNPLNKKSPPCLRVIRGLRPDAVQTLRPDDVRRVVYK